MLVSINCMAYNHEKVIRDALEGFLLQETSFEFEILIGEDCSTDQTRTIIQEYVEKYPDNIKLITSENNVGWKKNSERLLKHSSGKYIALCEGDDYWTDPGKLQKQVEYMENHPECSLCFHRARIEDENGRATGEEIRPYNENNNSPIEDIILGGGGFCPTASLLFPKALIENPPDFIQEAHVGDYPLQMWLASQGEVYYFDEVMSVYRTGVTGSWTNQLHSGDHVIEKKIKAKRADIDLLIEFDDYTNKQFSTVVNHAVSTREFEILILQNNIKEIRKEKYQQHYHHLNHVEKAKIYMRAYIPKLYDALLETKRKVNNRTKND